MEDMSQINCFSDVVKDVKFIYADLLISYADLLFIITLR